MDADTTLVDLQEAIARRIEPTALAARIHPRSVRCDVVMDGTRLQVTMTGPAIDPSARHALAVHVIDAIRAGGRVYGQVVIGYEEA